MDFVLTKHAKRQLLERDISYQELERTLLKLDNVITDNGQTIYQSVITHQGRDYLLRVITVKPDGQTKVLTVYRTRKIIKYLKP